MRLGRTVSLILAAIMAVTMSAAFVSPSNAGVSAASHRLMKPRHDLQAAGTEVGTSNHFVIYGTLTTYPKVFLFRKVGNGAFNLYRKVKVQDNGRWRTRVYQHQNDRTCFKVGVPETDDYQQVIRAVGCITSH
jgi:hypothetical protein